MALSSAATHFLLQTRLNACRQFLQIDIHVPKRAVHGYLTAQLVVSVSGGVNHRHTATGQATADHFNQTGYAHVRRPPEMQRLSAERIASQAIRVDLVVGKFSLYLVSKGKPQNAGRECW